MKNIEKFNETKSRCKAVGYLLSPQQIINVCGNKQDCEECIKGHKEQEEFMGRIKEYRDKKEIKE